MRSSLGLVVLYGVNSLAGALAQCEFLALPLSSTSNLENELVLMYG